MAFVHLHVHSQYSILDGTMEPAAIAREAARLSMPAVALTDTCNLYGAVNFFKSCKEEKIKAILGAELHVQPEGIAHEDGLREEGGYQVVALIENAVGYGNLCTLITDAIFQGNRYKPRVDLHALAARREGLIFLSGGRKGVVGRQLLRGHPEEAEFRARELSDCLAPDQLYLELQDHGLAGEDTVNEATRRIAGAIGRPLVVTNAVHYLVDEDAVVHELLNAISTGHSLADPRRVLSPTDQAYFKSEPEMRAIFPDDADAIERTAEIAARCDFRYTFGQYHFPATQPPDVAAEGEAEPDTDANWAYFFHAFPPPRDFGLALPDGGCPPRVPGAGNLRGYFEWYATKGLELRLRDVDPERHAAYRDRLRYEMDVIAKMGFCAYLLIVAEFINWSKDHGIPVGPGRGSAAGSLAAFAMRITDVDPLQYVLLFERFLNPERVSMPDIDVDFCQDRREEVIEHVRSKYGSDLVSQIITYGKLKAKAAVRDVARALDLRFDDVNPIAKLVPEDLGITLGHALEQVEQLRILREGDPKIRRILHLAQAIEGTCRQTGVHAAGVVIADRPLVQHAPLYRDEPGGGPVVQYDMKSVESVGLIKFDFLGLKTLDQIRDTLDAVERNHGVRIDLARIPLDDPDTYALLQSGDALGVFQLESSGMRNLLTDLKPSCIDDMVALVALYRPGPLSSGMTADFVLRKHDPSRIEYALPTLEPILRSTYGTVVYQEQVMQTAQVMAGYSLGEADLLRRAMGKKDKDVMEKQKARFVSGSVENGIDARRAEEIFDLLAKFAEYGFNKSHSAAYGLVSYQTAYLKAHYRPEYMAALMTIDAGDTDKVLVYIDDCRRAGIRIEPVCVNRSQRKFDAPPASERADGEVIRFGLEAVKNVGSGAVEAILEARREAGGAFRSAFDFFERIDHKRANKRVFESLVKAGALDFSGVSRRALMEGLEKAIALGQKRQREKEAGQGFLFASLPQVAATEAYRFPDLPEWPLSERLQHENEALGLYLTGHPMETHRSDIERFATSPLSTLKNREDGAQVELIGLPVDVRAIRTRRGDAMAFVKIADTDTTVECTFFSAPWAASQRALQSGEPVLVRGKVEHKGEETKILADSAEKLSDCRKRAIREVRFDLTLDDLAGARLVQFKELLQKQRGDCACRLRLDVRGRCRADFTLPEHRVEPNRDLEEGAAALFGRKGTVVLL